MSARKTIVVTGANGYIGRHVLARLSDLDAEVVAIDVVEPDHHAADRWIIADLFDPSFSFESHFASAPDVVLHLAWRNGFNHNADTHMGDLSGHYAFLMKAVEFGVPMLSVMGSMHEVGYWEGAIDENTPCNPQSLYAVAKDSLRRSLFLEQGRRGFKLQWLRGFYVYGDDGAAQSIFGKLLRAANAGQKSFPFTTGKNKFDFTRIDDLAEMIARSVMQDEVTGIINCCSGKPVSLAEEVEDYIEAHGLDISLEYGAYPDRPYDSPGIWGDPAKINQILHTQGCSK